MEQIGAFSYCRSKVAEYSKLAGASLKEVRDSPFKDYLFQFFKCVNKTKKLTTTSNSCAELGCSEQVLILHGLILEQNRT